MNDQDDDKIQGHDVLTEVTMAHSRTKSHSLILLLVATFMVCIYVLAISLVKLTFFSSWTWLGFLSHYKAVGLIVVFICSPLGYVWYAWRRERVDETLLSHFDKFLSGKLLYILGICISLVIVLALSLSLVNPSPFPDIDEFIVQHNWMYASDRLATAKSKEPLHQDIVFSYELYIDIHMRSSGNNFESGGYHRNQKAALGTEIERQRGRPDFNILSFAEVSKILYHIEDLDSTQLMDAFLLLDSAILVANNRNELALYQQKSADLHLILGKYDTAHSLYENINPPSKVQRAQLLANIGTSLYGLGKVEEALSCYERAELDYPEGRRALFYSNFGYMLMQGGRFERAKKMIKRALAIEPQDWYSHLNLGLLYDATGNFLDAVATYDLVLQNESFHDFVREARLLKAYSLIRSGATDSLAIREILIAIDRSPASALSYLEPAMAKELYESAARALEKVNTIGIERYIGFFDSLALTETLPLSKVKTSPLPPDNRTPDTCNSFFKKYELDNECNNHGVGVVPIIDGKVTVSSNGISVMPNCSQWVTIRGPGIKNHGKELEFDMCDFVNNHGKKFDYDGCTYKIICTHLHTTWCDIMEFTVQMVP